MEQNLCPPGLTPATEANAAGNIPPGYDPATSRTVYVGNLHPMVTESLLAEMFSSVGPLESCKLIRKERSSFGFVDYVDHAAASVALQSLDGKQLLGFPVKVNWAFTSGQREDTSSHFNIFVGDLSPEVTDAVLRNSFSAYQSCSDARVIWDQRTGRSRGFGFVSFRSQTDAERAMMEMNGQWIGNRPIRCNWAAKSTSHSGVPGSNPVASQFESSTQPQWEAVPGTYLKSSTSSEALQNPANNTTVYVGNLAPEVTEFELRQHFQAMGVGAVEDVRVQKDKGFGFVKFSTHGEAAAAIQIGNGRLLWGRSIKCSWGNKKKPTTPTIGPLVGPVPVVFSQGLQPTYGGYGVPYGAVSLPSNMSVATNPYAIGGYNVSGNGTF